MAHNNPEGEPIGLNAHSFIVRVWLEDNEASQQPEHDKDDANWRGTITHVPSGDRKYFKTLSEIDVFIRSYFTPPTS